MATNAARNALENAGITAEDLDLIIVATITPDTFTPSTACYVQDNLKAKNAIAFDISAACSGFMYAMKTAVQYLGTGQCRTALIIAAEKLSTVVNWEDRSTCVLFGDGSGAAILRRAEGPDDGAILATDIGTDGSLHSLLQIPGGGSACPITTENAHERLSTLVMRGNETFRHAVTHMKTSAETVIRRAGLTSDDISLIIPHQANKRIIDAVASRLHIPEDKVFVNLHKYGNTSAAACAIALDEAHREGRIKKGDNIIMVTFGWLDVGSCCYSLVIRTDFNNCKIHDNRTIRQKESVSCHCSWG
jgi:3-oxoacyl-[acyl-carrier-protein] synthase-3